MPLRPWLAYARSFARFARADRYADWHLSARRAFEAA